MTLTTIGKYVDLELVGQGGMAEVYLGTDPSLDRRVAIKLILPQLEVKEGFAERFYKEAKTLASLRHANIVQVHELSIHDGAPYMVMEYLGGGSLEQRLDGYRKNDASMPLDEIEKTIRSIAAALDYAHGLDVIHRDIKPANIMYTADGEPVVVDFGIAKILNDSIKLTATGGFIGTPQYSPPEQFDGKPVEKEGDIYSLGIMIYEMTSGQVPFDGTFVTVLLNHLNDPPPSMRTSNLDIPRRLEQAILTALNKSPSERYNSATEFADAIQAATASKDSVSAPVTAELIPVDTEAESLFNLLNEYPNNLPQRSTTFFGRKKSLAEIVGLLSATPATRLITLTGPGGVGKTRLSLEAAYLLLDKYKDGCYLVELDTIMDPEKVVGSIAQALDIKDDGRTPIFDKLVDELREKHMLLLLDNFEQVVESGGQIAKLLAACGQLQVIISSREILRVADEHAMRVPPLGFAGTGDDSSADDLRENPSVRLFVERAQATNPDYALTPESLEHISEICELLEGLPLAIELAAARARIFTSEELLARLHKNFKALSRKSRSLPARQTTIEGAIQWSYDLLEDEEKTLFRRLSIFVGGWSLESCEQICSDGLNTEIFELVETMIDKSIIYETVDATGQPRFRFLETVRVFALDLFNGLPEEEQDALIKPYIEYFTELAGKSTARAKAPEIIPKVEKEYGNIRKTFELAGSRNLSGHRLRISSNLWHYWYVKGGLREGIDWLNISIQENPAGQERLLGQAHLGLAILLRIIGQTDVSDQHLDTAYDIFQQSHDDYGQARSLNNYAHIEIAAGNRQKAIELFKQALVKAKGTNDEIYAMISSNLGTMYLEEERYAEAQSILEESLSLGIKIGSAPEIYYAEYGLAEVAYKLERYAQAREHVYSSLLQILKITTLWGAGVSLPLLGRIEIREEHYARGIVLCAAAEQFRKIIELKLDDAEQDDLDAMLAIANEKVGEEQSIDLIRQGAKMSFEDALRYALEDFAK